MNKLLVSAIVAAGVAAPALSQAITTVTNGAYTYQFRIVMDGDGNAPSGAWAQFPNTLSLLTSQVGFWLQARVTQTSGSNYGIARASAPGAPNSDFVTVTDSAASTVLNRGFTSATTSGITAHTGRGAGYTSGGRRSGNYRWITSGVLNSDADHTVMNHIISQDTATGNNGNNSASRATEAALNPAVFPGVTNAENGAFDSANHRIYGFDAYVGSTRSGLTDNSDPDNPITNINPWNVNGTAGVSNGGNGANPVPNDGTYSPWASLYRFVVLINDHLSERDATIASTVQLNGTVQSAETSQGSGSWALQLANPGTNASAAYNLHIVPTPGAATLLGAGLLAAARRRRA